VTPADLPGSRRPTRASSACSPDIRRKLMNATPSSRFAGDQSVTPAPRPGKAASPNSRLIDRPAARIGQELEVYTVPRPIAEAPVRGSRNRAVVRKEARDDIARSARRRERTIVSAKLTTPAIIAMNNAGDDRQEVGRQRGAKTFLPAAKERPLVGRDFFLGRTATRAAYASPIARGHALEPARLESDGSSRVRGDRGAENRARRVGALE